MSLAHFILMLSELDIYVTLRLVQVWGVFGINCGTKVPEECLKELHCLPIGRANFSLLSAMKKGFGLFYILAVW